MEEQKDKLLIGLDPIVSDGAKVLILGSMPGRQSLENGRYYDYGQNKFWKIIFALFGEEKSDDYAVKTDLLGRGKIALWDSIASCRRDGSSLDSRIRDVTPSDIGGFLSRYPSIEHVVTNGKAAEKYFRKYNPTVPCVSLPSTSPANAAVKNVEEIWISTLKKLLGL